MTYEELFGLAASRAQYYDSLNRFPAPVSRPFSVKSPQGDARTLPQYITTVSYSS